VPKDSLAPQTYIATNALDINATTATFKFASSEPGTFYCSLDDSTFTVCASPMKYTNLRGDTHEFRVYAVDAAGNVDASPAKYTWTIRDWKSFQHFRGR
jgi:hypothetical protein